MFSDGLWGIRGDRNGLGGLCEMLRQWFISLKKAGRWGEALRLTGVSSWVRVVRFGGRAGVAVEGEVVVGAFDGVRGICGLNARKMIDRHLD